MGSIRETILDDIIANQEVTWRFNSLDDIIIFVIEVNQCLRERSFSASWRSRDQNSFRLIPQELKNFFIQIIIFDTQLSDRFDDGHFQAIRQWWIDNYYSIRTQLKDFRQFPVNLHDAVRSGFYLFVDLVDHIIHFFFAHGLLVDDRFPIAWRSFFPQDGTAFLDVKGHRRLVEVLVEE